MRKGSALLIVLGMLSFMLFSGIAFSVYMRQTRPYLVHYSFKSNVRTFPVG